MFIQTEETPNPNALKFYPGDEVNKGEPLHYFSKEECTNSKLASKLFDTSGVHGVFFGSDFITITKDDSSDWEVLKPEILMTIMDHFVSGLPVFEEENTGSERTVDTENLSELEKQIVEIIDTRVRPAVAMDGGDIIYQGYEEGVVYLALHGSCSGCPSSTITLKNGIESMLQHYLPEVKSVEATSM